MNEQEVDGRPLKVKIFKSYENFKKEKNAGQSPNAKPNEQEEQDWYPQQMTKNNIKEEREFECADKLKNNWIIGAKSRDISWT